MKKLLLMKTMLLLCALIVGSSSVWATSVTFTAGTDTGESSVTKDGVTVSMSTMQRDDNYRTYANTDMTVSSTVGNISSIIITCTGSGTANYGPGKFSGTGYTYSGTTGTWTGSATTVTLSASAQVRITEIVVTLEGSGTSYTIIAESNNNTWGTVALSGTTITATPASGYQVSTSTPYEVTSGTASVAQSGNAFVVTPSSNCTIRINFEAIPNYTVTITAPENGTLSVKVGDTDVTSGDKYPAGTVLKITATPNDDYNFKNIQVIDASTHTLTASNIMNYTLTAHDTQIKANFTAKVYHKVTFSVNGDASNQTNVEEGKSIVFPANPSDLGGKTFVGWAETPIVGTTDDAPSFVSSATMGTEDVTYYAVYATVSGLTPASWTEAALDAMTASDIFVLSDGEYAMTNDNGTTSAPTATAITVLEGKITSSVADKMKWQVSGNATDGYIFYPSGSTETWLYCNTTASSSSNNNIRVGVGNRKLWKFNNAGYLVTNDTYTNRYLCIYNEQDFRGYTSTANAFVPKFYKYVAASGIYSEYSTDVKVNVAVSAAGLATFANDYALDFTNVENLEAYIAKENGTTIELEKVNKVPANTGVLLRAKNSATDFNVPVTTAAADDVAGNIFVRGTGAAVATDAGEGKTNYVLGKHDGVVGFYKAGGMTVATHKAYLQTTIAAARIDVNFDETTALTLVNSEKRTVNSAVFNLAGQRVANPTKGLYIVNGKKVVVK